MLIVDHQKIISRAGENLHKNIFLRCLEKNVRILNLFVIYSGLMLNFVENSEKLIFQNNSESLVKQSRIFHYIYLHLKYFKILCEKCF